MRGRVKTPYLFVAVCSLPAFALTVYVIIWPAIQVFARAFTDSTVLGVRQAKFVGFKNFVNMANDKYFAQAFMNTAKLVIVSPVITVTLALITAFAVTQSRLKERGFYRSVLFFPSVVSITVIGVVWSFIFHPTRGVLNRLLAIIGYTSFEEYGFAWLTNKQTAVWAISAAFIWQSAGYFMVMHIAAIDAIPKEILEAATIDGAGAFRGLINITLPLIKDIVGITFIFSLSGILDSSFTFSRIMTPKGQAEVLLSYSYTQGFANARYGYAMAITAFTLVCAIMLAAVSRLIVNGRKRL